MLEQCSDVHKKISNLSNRCSENSLCLKSALTDVLCLIESGKFLNFWEATETLYQYYLSKQDEKKYDHYIVPQKSRLMRRVTLTPTRLLLWPEEIII